MKTNKFALIIINLLFITTIFSQTSGLEVIKSSVNEMHSVKEYPEGFYYSYEDFINKNVRPPLDIERRSLYRNRTINNDSIVNQLFFFSMTDTTKVTEVFAISHKGNLYIQQQYISKYAKKGNRNEAGENPNCYHRVIKDGKYFYLEGAFGNVWAKGVTGGLVGGALASTINNLKGVVFEFNTKKFDFIKNCKDFKLFLTEHNSDEQIDCEKYNLLTVREIIDKLIK